MTYTSYCIVPNSKLLYLFLNVMSNDMKKTVYSTGPLIRNTYFEQGLKPYYPRGCKCNFLFHHFLSLAKYIALISYFLRFLFPAQLFPLTSYGSHCFFLVHHVVVSILKTNFRCQFYRTCVTTSV